MLALFESGDHAINILEISHWTMVSGETRNELTVCMKNGEWVCFSGELGSDVLKRLKAFAVRVLNG